MFGNYILFRSYYYISVSCGPQGTSRDIKEKEKNI